MGARRRPPENPQSRPLDNSLLPYGLPNWMPKTTLRNPSYSRPKPYCKLYFRYVNFTHISSRTPSVPKPYTLNPIPQRVHVGIWYILRAQRGSHIPTLRPKYTLYSYMDPLGSKVQAHCGCTLRSLRPAMQLSSHSGRAVQKLHGSRVWALWLIGLYDLRP